MDSPNFAYAILKKIQQRIELTKDSLTGGSFKTMEEYKQVVGELKGLQVAEREIKDQLESKEDNFD